MARKSPTVPAPAPVTAAPAPVKARRKGTGAPVAHLDTTREKSGKAPAKRDAKGQPRNALSTVYAPALAAMVAQVVDAARNAASAGIVVAERLAEAFAMEPHKATGHQSATAWAHALLTEACPMAGTSTVYAWIEAGLARTAVVKAGIDPALFPMDTLRVIGSKGVTGQDPGKMADLAKRLAKDPEMRNGAGKVDPRKARDSVKGKGPGAGMDHGEKIAALIKRAKQLAGTPELALTLLEEAAERLGESK